MCVCVCVRQTYFYPVLHWDSLFKESSLVSTLYPRKAVETKPTHSHLYRLFGWKPEDARLGHG